jgi:hypothetical protein
MRELRDRLWEIAEKAGRSLPLSKEELEFAEGCLAAPRAQERASACEILLRSSESEVTRHRALAEVEHLCQEAREEDWGVTLLNALLYVSPDDLTKGPTLSAFILRCASSPGWAMRTNAVSLLEVLARLGNGEAKRLIKGLAYDANDYARMNALNALARLKR